MPAQPHVVVLALSDRMPIFEVAVPCEVFADRPRVPRPWYEFSIAVVGDRPVTLGPGFQLPAGHSPDLERADTLIVPACPDLDDPPADLVRVVRDAHARGARILSICTGAFVLAAAGILDGRRATTHWMHAERLARHHPAVRVDASVLYLEDENVITSAGTAAGIDACLHVVRVDHGAAVAADLARRMVTPPHRAGGQAQFHRPAPPATDDWLAPLLGWVGGNLHMPLVTADLAEQANVSVRTLERRFAAALGMSPLQWLLHQRVYRAQELLETSDQPVRWIAATCGFGTAASLRAHFGRIVGAPPAAYRQTFRHRA